MQSFLARSRYPFSRRMLEGAPDELGVYGLFQDDELIYVGAAHGSMTIRTCLLLHQDGALGACTMKATAYSWELSRAPGTRSAEILTEYLRLTRKNPRCQGKAAA
jgi:hypothetical protein